MSTMNQLKHWRLNKDNDAILWTYLDKANTSANTLDREVMDELAEITKHLYANTKDYKGWVIASGKEKGFIMGADITQFDKFKNIDEAVDLLKLGQLLFQKIEQLPIPTVAMVNGFCLGGGLELALSCRYIVAEESAKTKLGLPEVMLGIHPGWGGTVRLPRRVGATKALEFMMTGRMLIGKAAAKIGLVDAAVPKRQLVHAARYYILSQPQKRTLSFVQSMMNVKPIRQVLAHFMRKKLSEKALPSHYPSPFQMIDNWEELGVDTDAAYDKEARTCGKLFFSETCRNLVRIFFLQEKMKGMAKQSSFKPTHIHVIGAGTMGGDIAAWCARRGLKVTLQDLEPKLIAPAIKRAYKLFKDKLKEEHLVQQAMDRLIPDVAGNGIAQADVIIEAVVEKLEVKQALFKKIEMLAKPNAILATNTSSIPLDEINPALTNPERLVGIHFFNPVSKMMLVEVVRGKKTSQEVFDNAISFVRVIDRLPLPVKSSPGFLINRILMPYLLESVKLVKEGVPMEVVDQAMKEFGMPMGPVTLADTVGLDVCLSVADYLGKYFDAPVPEELREYVQKGKLGKKSGEGFYKYDKQGKMIKRAVPKFDKPLSEVSDRLVLRILNEAFLCLEEGVIDDADLLDAGMIFGTGFAPFRGGPIHYAKTQGIDELYQQFIKQTPENKPAKAWRETVES